MLISKHLTRGLPRRVELNSDGSLKTLPVNAKHGDLHFNCSCTSHFREAPPLSAALQKLLELDKKQSYNPVKKSAQQMQADLNNNAAQAADGIGKKMRMGVRRVRTLSRKAQESQQEQIEKKKKTEEEKSSTADDDSRRCWNYGNDSHIPCTRALRHGAVLGELCSYHARCALAELVVYVKEKYESGGAALMSEYEDAKNCLEKSKIELKIIRVHYTKLLHELRLDFFVAEQRRGNKRRSSGGGGGSSGSSSSSSSNSDKQKKKKKK